MLGVLTGNLEAIAQEKLKKTNLSKYFTTGYFGDASKFRADLAKNAADDAVKVYNISKEDVFVIGDTPRDINAGKAAGVRTIGVASGIYSEKELLSAEPDLVVSNLHEVEPIKKIILG
jgi:phosphoglycolate phosphatase-like HAD superfamily hydrolase